MWDLRILLMMMKFGWKSFVNDAEEEVIHAPDWRRVRMRMGVCRDVRRFNGWTFDGNGKEKEEKRKTRNRKKGSQC